MVPRIGQLLTRIDRRIFAHPPGRTARAQPASIRFTKRLLVAPRLRSRPAQREDTMVTDTVEASAITVKGRFCGSPNTASCGYIAGLLGRLMDGPARVSLERPVPVDHGLGIERLGDGGLALTDGSTILAHASAATLQLEPPAP